MDMTDQAQPDALRLNIPTFERKGAGRMPALVMNVHPTYSISWDEYGTPIVDVELAVHNEMYATHASTSDSDGDRHVFKVRVKTSATTQM